MKILLSIISAILMPLAACQSALGQRTVHPAAPAEYLIPSHLDPQLSEAREKVFAPWGNPDEARARWEKLSIANVPIYNEGGPGNLQRDLYIPNPGLAYWVLGGLSKAELWRTQAEKLKIGDELVSASVSRDENGTPTYWALWAPRNRAHLLKDKMRELGIAPAEVVSDSGEPFSGRLVFHQKTGNIVYDLTINDGQVRGWQSVNSDPKPIAEVVGGWFDLGQGKLSLLIVGTAEGMDPKWHAQAQQFQVDLEAREVTLEHMLYGYGLTAGSSATTTAHVLDKLDRVEHLVR